MNRVRSLLSDRWSRIFLAAAALALVIALVVGVSDNPPGLLLAYAACFGGVAAFTTRWTGPRPFLILAGSAAAAFPVFAFLHNVFDALAEMAAALPLLPGLCTALSVASFLLAVLVAPAAVVVGLAGALKSWIQGRRMATA